MQRLKRLNVLIWTSFSSPIREVRRPRRATADNLWAPPIFVDGRAFEAADPIVALYLFCCNFKFSPTKKGHQNSLRIELYFSGIFEKNIFFAAADFLGPAARWSRHRPKLTGEPTKIDRRAPADTMTSAHVSTVYL